MNRENLSAIAVKRFGSGSMLHVRFRAGLWVGGPETLARIVDNSKWKITRNIFRPDKINIELISKDGDWSKVPVEFEGPVTGSIGKAVRELFQLLSSCGFIDMNFWFGLFYTDKTSDLFKKAFVGSISKATRESSFGPRKTWRGWMFDRIVVTLFEGVDE